MSILERKTTRRCLNFLFASTPPQSRAFSQRGQGAQIEMSSLLPWLVITQLTELAFWSSFPFPASVAIYRHQREPQMRR